MEEYYRLRIYIGESDRYKGKPLYHYILEFLHKKGLKGATVYRGIAGYGSHSLIHTRSILRLSEDLPIIIETIDTQEKIMGILGEIRELVKEGMITLEKVQVIYYGHQ